MGHATQCLDRSHAPFVLIHYLHLWARYQIVKHPISSIVKDLLLVSAATPCFCGRTAPSRQILQYHWISIQAVNDGSRLLTCVRCPPLFCVRSLWVTVDHLWGAMGNQGQEQTVSLRQLWNIWCAFLTVNISFMLILLHRMSSICCCLSGRVNHHLLLPPTLSSQESEWILTCFNIPSGGLWHEVFVGHSDVLMSAINSWQLVFVIL